MNKSVKFVVASVTALVAFTSISTVQASDYLGGIKARENMVAAERREGFARHQERAWERSEQRAKNIAKGCAAAGNWNCAERFAKIADRRDAVGDAWERREKTWDRIGDANRAKCKREGVC